MKHSSRSKQFHSPMPLSPEYSNKLLFSKKMPFLAQVDNLAWLIKEANRGHFDAVDTVSKSLDAARRSGHALNRAKALVDHGDWTFWLTTNFRCSLETARVYMRIARK